MEYSFINQELDKKLLTSYEISGINRFLLENSSKPIDLMYKFLEGSSNLLLVNGFLGTGKTALVEHVLSFLSTDSIVLNYNCFETTVLDDVLLTFFEEFKKLSALKKITIPNIKAENFTQKINAYFELIEKPIVVVINSFDAILKHNKSEIIGFVEFIANLKNVKVILVSRTFDLSDFGIKFDRTTVLALDKSVFEKYLRAEDCKQIGPLSDELYKHTRGYFFYTNLSLKIMKLRNLSLVDFLDGFGKSFLSFNDFILREALALIDPVSGHLFRFLTIMRHPVSIKLLKTLHLYNDEKVLFFLNNNVLCQFGEYIYLPDYYKTIAENSISEGVAVKLHQGCVDLYNTQLPLKPLERDLVISRQTMRNEIEYHSIFIPKRQILQQTTTNKEEISTPINTDEIISTKEQKDEIIQKMSFIFDDDPEVLDQIADSIKNFMTYSDKRIEEEKEENTLTLTELMNRAKQYEQDFDYKHTISLYLKSLAHKDDDDYYTFLPTIYTKLAFAYQKVSNWFEAQKYFESALEFYKSSGDIEKVNENKYRIANVLYMSYKRDKAKEILSEILQCNISDELRIKTLVLLANLTSNKAFDYYKEAIALNPLGTDKEVLSELYYKFAIENENNGEDEIAVNYYKKCISLEMKKNPYLSDALSNIACLYDDIGETNLAIKYYQESLKIDENNRNLNGVYSSLMKLAEIYLAKEPQKSLEYYEKALDIAKALNESFYIVSTEIELGDFYFNRLDHKFALKYYKDALTIVEKLNNKENITKIQMRINDIKLRIGEERFIELER